MLFGLVNDIKIRKPDPPKWIKCCEGRPLALRGWQQKSTRNFWRAQWKLGKPFRYSGKTAMLIARNFQRTLRGWRFRHAAAGPYRLRFTARTLRNHEMHLLASRGAEGKQNKQRDIQSSLCTLWRCMGEGWYSSTRSWDLRSSEMLRSVIYTAAKA